MDLLSPDPECDASSHGLPSLQLVALTTPDVAAAVMGFCQGPEAEDVAPTQKQTVGIRKCTQKCLITVLYT